MKNPAGALWKSRGQPHLGGGLASSSVPADTPTLTSHEHSKQEGKQSFSFSFHTTKGQLLHFQLSKQI